MALALCAAQIDGERSQRGEDAPALTLGWVYFSEHYLAEAPALLAELKERWPGVQWVGGCGLGVLAGVAEYSTEPALALMLAALEPTSFQLFSGLQPLGNFPVHALQVHVDLAVPDLPELLHEVSERQRHRHVFGAVVGGGQGSRQIAGSALSGGLSGVAFDARVPSLTRVAQGCRPFGPVRRITGIQHNQVLTLDDRPALDCLLEDLGVRHEDLKALAPRLRDTVAGLTSFDVDGPALALDSRMQRRMQMPMQMRRLVGVGVQRGAVAVAEDFDAWPDDLQRDGVAGLAFCRQDPAGARRDLVRVCSEIRDELLSDEEASRLSQSRTVPLGAADDSDPAADWLRSRIAGAVYISCVERREAGFAALQPELDTLRHALGDVPLIGLHAYAEIADARLHSYSGVLTVFLRQKTP